MVTGRQPFCADIFDHAMRQRHMQRVWRFFDQQRCNPIFCTDAGRRAVATRPMAYLMADFAHQSGVMLSDVRSYYNITVLCRITERWVPARPVRTRSLACSGTRSVFVQVSAGRGAGTTFVSTNTERLP